jgi:hypothetical protein
VAEWQGREITGGYEAAPLADHGGANGRTDLHKVGFVFLRRVMLMELKIMRYTSR